ncbi:hypothetical protein ACS0TY_036827 [Phlomoides rotata]
MDTDSAAVNEDEKQHFHVLAVDDSYIDRKVLEKLLTVSSYQVTCVDSGDKALEYLGLVDIEENEYDSSSSQQISSSSKSSQQEVSKVNLIMTDYSMPGISGYDLLKRIKVGSPNRASFVCDSTWKDVPVVVMSSENVPSRINMCLEGGAEEFLLKPVKLSDLRKLHSHLLNTITDPCVENAICDVIESANNTNKEESEIDKNCSNTNKRKATASDLSDRRPRGLPVS